MLDPQGRVVSWNARRAADQGALRPKMTIDELVLAF